MQNELNASDVIAIFQRNPKSSMYQEDTNLECVLTRDKRSRGRHGFHGYIISIKAW
jgi:hypothetical protein